MKLSLLVGYYKKLTIHTATIVYATQKKVLGFQKEIISLRMINAIVYERTKILL